MSLKYKSAFDHEMKRDILSRYYKDLDRNVDNSNPEILSYHRPLEQRTTLQNDAEKWAWYSLQVQERNNQYFFKGRAEQDAQRVE